MKYLYAAAVTPNGAAVNVHRLQRVSLDAQRVLLTLNHYVDADQELPTWQDEYEMPLEQFQIGAYPDCVWDWICEPDGLFADGQVLEGLSTIDEEKKIKRHDIMRMRDGRISGGFEFQPFGVFQTDKVSTENIMGAVQMAVISVLVQQPFSLTFRLADDSEPALDAQDMIAVGAAVGVYRSAVYKRSWELKALVDAAESMEDLDAVVLDGWPVASNAT